MAFDWKKLERDEQDRVDRGGKALMFGYLGIGVVGVVLHLVTGYGRLESALMLLGMGLVSLAIWRHVSRRRSRRD